MGSIVHRSVPTNLKWLPNCSHAHALFQDRFKDVQVGSRWFSTLYILSPNFHKSNTVEMPVATLCAAASSGSARVPEPAIDSSTHVVSFVTLETRAIKDFEPAAAKTFPHGTKYRPTPDREAFNHKTLRLQIQPARYPQMRPQHHVQPLTNPPGHA